jgi:alpha-glucosidase
MIDRYEMALPTGAWPNWVLGNHDQHRVATRLGPAQARAAAMLLLTLRGTPTLYYGDELGLADAIVPPDRVQDPLEKRQPGQGFGRDPERSPMPWDPSNNGGFSAGMPWLPLVNDWRALNVERQRSAPQSMLALYRDLIGLRRSEPALEVGEYVGLGANGSVLAYMRRSEGHSTFLVALNLGASPAEFATDRIRVQGDIALTTIGKRARERIAGRVRLAPHEGVIIRLES